jgi:hypothetical protein
MSATTFTSLRIYPEALRSVSYLLISTLYTNIGSPLSNAARIIQLQNTTDVNVFISWDGVNDHQYLPAGSFVLLDVTANKSVSQQAWFVGARTQFYAKVDSGMPTQGSIFLTTFYGLVEGD